MEEWWEHSIVKEQDGVLKSTGPRHNPTATSLWMVRYVQTTWSWNRKTSLPTSESQNNSQSSHSPVHQVRQKGAKFTPVGFANKFNSGGAIEFLEHDMENDVKIEVKGAGKFLAYSSEKPEKVVLNGEEWSSLGQWGNTEVSDSMVWWTTFSGFPSVLMNQTSCISNLLLKGQRKGWKRKTIKGFV
ncbi:hypothetical protein Ancab_012981 [Ancistrocladus abbreviatus]